MKKKNGATTLPRGRVSRQSQRVWGVNATVSVLRKHYFAILKNICILWCWNLQYMLELPLSCCISKKPSAILIFRTFTAKFWIFWIFAYFTQNIAIFRSGIVSWRHNYVTPWPIVLILVCMSREGPYLPIDIKINTIGSSVWTIWGGSCNNPPHVLQKITWLDEG